MTGTSAAIALAGKGLRVLLLEAEALASRASGRNAGFVITNLAESYASVAARHGRAFARTIWQVNQDNRDRVGQLIRDHGIECSFAQPGSFCAASSPEEAEELRTSAAMMRQDGFDARFLEAAEARETLRFQGIHGALRREGDGQIQPARFVRGLGKAAEGRGVRIHEGTRVTQLRRAGKGWEAQGSGFRVEAEHVLVAANALAPALHPWFADKLLPVRGQVLATEPIPGLEVPGPVYADHGFDYWRAHEGRLILGGQRPIAEDEEVGLEETVNPRIHAALDKLLAQLLPGVKAKVTHRWAGIMDFSIDGFPLVGEVPGEPGLLAAVGFTGHGFGYATVSAEWLATRILEGKDVVPSPFQPGRMLDPASRPKG
jgi:glycine/D-amino acid oxidase-like deaminating enzyme